MSTEDVENRNMGCQCGYNKTPFNAENYMNDYNEDMNCSEGNMTREFMAKKIKSYEFAIIELGLYLDTHSDDARALCLHRKYCKEVKELKDKYQKVYGPLTINYPCNKWRWLEEPWPWERGNI